MPITITTLNNEAAAAKTFAEVAKDKVSSVWLNTTDSTSGTRIELQVRQSTLGPAPNGSPVRRSTVTLKHSVPSTVVMANGNSKTQLEQYTLSCTLTGPEVASVLTSTHRKDLAAYLRNFLVAANVDALAQGMV